MLKYFLILSLLSIVSIAQGGKSPHGEEYIESLGDLTSIPKSILEDAVLDVVGLVTKYGYPIQSYSIETEDGYIIRLHRIPSGKNNQGSGKTPVLLMHGVLSSSADWVNMGPEKSLGYILADEGFDVWMGNARGNFYSRKHRTLNPDKAQFWKFSWNEIGYYDLPAMINFILQKTEQKNLHYVGHSQGTTSFFVMASTRPEYNAKIRTMQALAPIAYMSNLKSPLVKLLAPMSNTIEAITSLIGVNEFFPSTDLMSMAGTLLCNDGSFFQPLCTNIMFLFCGYSPDQLNTTMLPVLMGHTPAGISSKQIVHYGQEHLSGKFRKYDFNMIGNLAEYGSVNPPNYILKNIIAPVALHYSDNDWLSEPTDVKSLNSELGNSISMFRVPHATFNHLDYMFGIDVKKLVYDRVINLMKGF